MPWRTPTNRRKVIIRKEPISIEGRRPKRSMKRIAGRVRRTLRMYWMEAVRRGEAMLAPCMMSVVVSLKILEGIMEEGELTDDIVHHHVHTAEL